MEANVFQFKEDSNLAVGKLHQALKGRSFPPTPKALRSAHIGFLVPAASTDRDIYIHI